MNVYLNIPYINKTLGSDLYFQKWLNRPVNYGSFQEQNIMQLVNANTEDPNVATFDYIVFYI